MFKQKYFVFSFFIFSLLTFTLTPQLVHNCFCREDNKNDITIKAYSHDLSKVEILKFPWYIVKISPFVRVSLNSCFLESLTKEIWVKNISYETLALLKKIIAEIIYDARNSEGEKVALENIDNNTIFVHELILGKLKPHIKKLKNEELDLLFLAVDYLGIEPLIEGCSYFIAQRIANSNPLFFSNLNINILQKELLDNGFSYYTSRQLYAILRNAQLMRLGVVERTIADYIGLYGQPHISNNILILNNFKLTSLKGLELIKNKNLEIIDLRYNYIYNDFDFDILKKPFESFKNLYTLDLSENHLVFLPDDFLAGLNNLTTLTISNNDIKYISEKLFENTPNISRIDFSYNKLDKILAKSFLKLKKLNSLNLSNNCISHLPEEIFWENIDLEELYLNSNNILSLKPNIFKKLVKLKNLYLSKNMLFSLPERVFSSLKKLENLYLTDNCIRELFSNNFEGLGNLKNLYLDCNRLTKIEKNTFYSLSNLKYLSLCNNNIKTIAEDAFNNLANLEALNLNSNDIINIPESTFKNLTNLQAIYLLDNKKLRNLSSEMFEGLPHLRIIFFSNNY